MRTRAIQFSFDGSVRLGCRVRKNHPGRSLIRGMLYDAMFGTMALSDLGDSWLFAASLITRVVLPILCHPT